MSCDRLPTDQVSVRKKFFKPALLVVLLGAALVFVLQCRLSPEERKLVGTWRFQTTDLGEWQTARFGPNRHVVVASETGHTFHYDWRVRNGRITLTQDVNRLANPTIRQIFQRYAALTLELIIDQSAIFDRSETYQLNWTDEESVELLPEQQPAVPRSSSVIMFRLDAEESVQFSIAR